MPTRTIGKILNTKENGELGELIQRAQSMGVLTETLSKALPDEFGGSVVAANIRADGELVVICRSSAWASRLRYESDTLLAAARSAGEDVQRCSVRVSHEMR